VLLEAEALQVCNGTYGSDGGSDGNGGVVATGLVAVRSCSAAGAGNEIG